MPPLNICELIERFVKDLPPGTCRFVIETINGKVSGIRADCWDGAAQGHYGPCHFNFWEIRSGVDGGEQVSHGLDPAQLPTYYKDALIQWLGDRFK